MSYVLFLDYSRHVTNIKENPFDVIMLFKCNKTPLVIFTIKTAENNRNLFIGSLNDSTSCMIDGK